MSDFDRMTTQLRQDVSRTRWPAPDDIRAAGSRRAGRRVGLGAAAVVVIVVAAIAVAVGTGNRQGITPGHPDPTATAPATSSPSTPTPGGRLAARQLVFVSADVGWMLASGPSIVHTTDGGRSWTVLPALPSDVPADGSTLLFADDRTGYLYAPDVLYLTRDGGTTWVRQPGGAFAMDLANGTVLRVSSTTVGCPPACTFQISRAPVGTADWHITKAEAGSGLGASLRRVGHRAVAVLYRNLAGGVSAHATLLTSADDGTTWATHPDPCGTSQGQESASGAMAMAADGSTTVLCFLRGGPSPTRTQVITSTDGGITFGPPHTTPNSALTVGAADATTVFVSALEGSTHRLYRSTDGGAQWTVVATGPDPVPNGAVAPTRIDFPTAQTGYWLPGYATVFLTTDSGATWTARLVNA